MTLVDALERSGQLEAAGGMSYLGTMIAETPSAANIVAYARIVREAAIKRCLIVFGSDQETAGYSREGGDSRTLLGAAQEALEAIAERGQGTAGGFVFVKTALTAAVEEIDRRFTLGTGMVGVSTGWADLDEKTRGLEPGSLIVVAARPSQGKTALAMQLAAHVAGLGVGPVAVFSLEMSQVSLSLRMLSAAGRVDHDHLRTGSLSDDEWPRLTSAVHLSAGRQLAIDDQSGLTAADIATRARRLKRERGGLSLIVIDYLQLIDFGRRRVENQNLGIGAITKRLKGMAKDLNVPVVLLSQLNRECEKRPNKRPQMSDLRDCLPVSEWVDTPAGPVRVGSRPTAVISTTPDCVVAAGCEYIAKSTNRVFSVSTEFGRFRATAKHTVLTGTGYKRVRDLVPGRDVIAAIRKAPHEHRGFLPHGRLLGWLLGNGSLSGTPGLIYRTELHDDVCREIAEFGVTVRPRKTQKSGNVVDAYLSNGTASGSLENPLMAWIREIGIEGLTAPTKEIPEMYLGSDDDTHMQLLRGLWEADGTVTVGKAKYATVSEKLAHQVKWLLLTIGVRSTIYREDSQGDCFPLYVVNVSIMDNKELAPIVSHPGRFGELKDPSPRYADPCPAIFVELVHELLGHRSPVRLQRRANGSFKQITRDTLRGIMATHPIQTIIDSPFMRYQHLGWAPVQSVILNDDEDVSVCDLSVPGPNCFSTNGLVVHNSGSIEQDADLIAFIYRDEVYDKESKDKGTAEIILAKQRNGATGVVRLGFQGRYCRFDNLAPEWRQEDSEGWR